MEREDSSLCFITQAKCCIPLLSFWEILTFYVREAEISVITARDREAMRSIIANERIRISFPFFEKRPKGGIDQLGSNSESCHSP